jgi:hypothetical protein
MHRLFSDLVVSRDGATARRAGLAFPASLVLHAAALTLLALVSIITRDALPPVEAPSASGSTGRRFSTGYRCRW